MATIIYFNHMTQTVQAKQENTEKMNFQDIKEMLTLILSSSEIWLQIPPSTEEIEDLIR